MNVTDPEKHADVAYVATEVKLMHDLNEQRRPPTAIVSIITQGLKLSQLLQTSRSRYSLLQFSHVQL